MQEKIEIIKAAEHNLKGVSLTIPHKTLTVMSGVSGSGKSSLAFDTIFKEGQRRYLESLSAYARQFLGVMSKSDVEHIEGLSPTISIDQKSVNKNPRSTVGTVTEVYDFIRLLFARLGTPYCSQCGTKISRQSEDSIARNMLLEFEGERALILAPIVRDRKGEYRKEIEEIKSAGFIRVRIDGHEINLEDESVQLKRYEKHTIEIIIDRIRLEQKNLSRITEAVERAVGITKGLAAVYVLHEKEKEEESKGKAKTKLELSAGESDFYRLYTTERSCAECGHSVPEIEPNLFSFNNPAGACRRCNGLGVVYNFSEELLIADEEKTIYDGALACFVDGHLAFDYSYGTQELEIIAKAHNFRPNKPWKKFTKRQKELLINGPEEELTSVKKRRSRFAQSGVVGIAQRLDFMYKKYGISHYEKFMEELTCPECAGSRLNGEALSVSFRGKNIGEFTAMTVEEALEYFSAVKLEGNEKILGEPIVKEIFYRLTFLQKVGLSYLTLNRSAPTLSGGESQRIRLAAQIGSGLEGVLYVLDEPSIGLHQSDNRKLIESLKTLRNRNNTVIVVEHDRDTMEAADYMVDIGPYAGLNGGEITASGSLKDIMSSGDSVTGAYLRGDSEIEVPKRRRVGSGDYLELIGARHFNLKGVDVKIPLGTFTAVTGVSGSGKSTLINMILKRALFRHFYNSKQRPGKHEEIRGLEHIDKVVEIDQDPIGRTPRSNPATYTKVFTPIRELFAQTKTAKMRGYTKSRFSFNVDGGRCPVCQGAGIVELQMQFLENVSVPCEECNGKRFNSETLDVHYGGKSIYDVLEMSIDEAAEFFSAIPSILRVLDTMRSIGLGYIKLGQPSTTLSGGEAQRIKLASELRKKATGRTFYILDEPTTGLHFDDIKKLMAALQGLVDKGNTVVVIEHNMDVIKCADYLIDLGPSGGEGGGRLIFEGSPEGLAECKESLTGIELAYELDPSKKPQAKDDGGPSKEFEKEESLKVIGAKKHNLKNVNIEFPKNSLCVVSGVSGSGKSSLAFDTVFKEGQRRFVESLSTYARRFLGKAEDAEVEKIEGLAPAIAIDQKNVSRNPRSTVATVTEIYDYMRLLYARTAKAYCPHCGEELRSENPSALASKLARNRAKERLYVCAPLYDKSLQHRFVFSDEDVKDTNKLMSRVREGGYHRVIVNGEEFVVDDITNEDEERFNEDGVKVVDAVIDRIIVDPKKVPRIAEALENAFEAAEGAACLIINGEREYHTRFPSCLEHGVMIDYELSPRHFSFNSHWGYCESCKGIGSRQGFDHRKAIVDGSKSLFDGALADKLHHYFGREQGAYGPYLRESLSKEGVDVQKLWSTPYNETPEEVLKIFFYGNGKRKGVAQYIEGWTQKNDVMSEDYSEWIEESFSPFLSEQPCSACGGKRLNPQALMFKIEGEDISELCGHSTTELRGFFHELPSKLSERDMVIAGEVIKEVENRLTFLEKVGLGYLTLSRKYATLSGGESQRIRLSGQLGSRLTGVLYVLDEPTVGLHPRDTGKLLSTLEELRDLGNTVIVVEHDKETMEKADFIAEMGPQAGILGGELIYSGAFDGLMQSDSSLTAKYLRKEMKVYDERELRSSNGELLLSGVRTNNLKGVDLRLPLGTFCCISGVSGSGKSSLILDTLYPALKSELKGSPRLIDSYDDISFSSEVRPSSVIVVDQIGVSGSIRSTLVSFLKIFSSIRRIFAKTPVAKAKGFGASRFTYNGKEGSCKICEGRGFVKVAMHFLSDVEVQCEECRGRRYNDETLAVKFKGLSIADVFELSVSEGAEFFENHKAIRKALRLLEDVGLSYLKLGQRLDTLSGGELQRLKLSRELAKNSRGAHTLYILDEPTTGLHFDDVRKLIAVINRLVDKGNSCVVIEHSPELISACDYVIDMGPEGGDAGGSIIAEGSPAELKARGVGHTAQYI